ncbi:phosphotransferase system IIA component [Vibrio ishigakensis]|uniref:Phosphotransferase system IIA component n=1 Tax=Vibrio ishigakensis TaxID=1481914 RepID=A0A0B8NXQ0_9VIBR|nr:DUF3389 domain-containing protein [Vibrio ishigakensis]GAM55853.1 phosphotransferase system IIA component [Vibrio ishigakensis]
MTFDFELGKIVVTPHEIMIRLFGEQRMTLQAHTDVIQLMGNVLVVHDAQSRWSVKLDSEIVDQIIEITGLARVN